MIHFHVQTWLTLYYIGLRSRFISVNRINMNTYYCQIFLNCSLNFLQHNLDLSKKMSDLKRNANIFRNVIWSKLRPTPVVQLYQQNF